MKRLSIYQRICSCSDTWRRIGTVRVSLVLITLCLTPLAVWHLIDESGLFPTRTSMLLAMISWLAIPYFNALVGLFTKSTTGRRIRLIHAIIFAFLFLSSALNGSTQGKEGLQHLHVWIVPFMVLPVIYVFGTAIMLTIPKWVRAIGGRSFRVALVLITLCLTPLVVWHLTDEAYQLPTRASMLFATVSWLAIPYFNACVGLFTKNTTGRGICLLNTIIFAVLFLENALNGPTWYWPDRPDAPALNVWHVPFMVLPAVYVFGTAIMLTVSGSHGANEVSGGAKDKVLKYTLAQKTDGE